jgi:hypothetical protein
MPLAFAPPQTKQPFVALGVNGMVALLVSAAPGPAPGPLK